MSEDQARPRTIREIAEEAGVSTATVSRVFSRPEQVSRETRDRVIAVSQRHHFVSDGVARSLVSRRSGLLGLIIPTVTNSIYASFIQSAQDAAAAGGFTVLLGISNYSETVEAAIIHKFIEQRVEGLILTGVERPPEIFEKIRRNGLSFVISWKLARDRQLPSVSFDNQKGAEIAVDHLVSLGHRSIGLMCGRTAVNDRARDRRIGFERRMREHGLAVDASLISERDFEFIEGRAAMQGLLHGKRRPTAVFCANDILAIGALVECQQAGLKVPGDVSIVGFDDLPVAQYVSPQLTTVRVPASEMGRHATEALLRAIAGENIGLGLELPIDLTIRGSTARPASDA